MFNVIIFEAITASHHSTLDIAVLQRTDALTSALTLPTASQRSPVLMHAYQQLIELPEWRRLAPRLQIKQLFGDGNIVSDRISRADWSAFHRFCQQLGVKPVKLPLPESVWNIYHSCVAVLRAGVPSDASGSEWHSSPVRPLHLYGDAAVGLTVAGAGGALGKLTGKATGRSITATAATAPTATAVAPVGRARLNKLISKSRPEVTQPVALATAAPSTAQPRSIAGLVMPPKPPGTAKIATTSLAVASRHYARQRAEAFTHGANDMAFNISVGALAEMTEALDEGILYGVNANTGVMDARAWTMWEEVCRAYGTSPLRTAQDARDNPERNAHLLAALMMRAFVVCRSRTPGRAFIKPRSALAYPLAIVRIFARWSVVMPSYKLLKAALAYLSRLYLAYYGPYSLAPHRAEPMKYSMVLRMDAIPDGEAVGSISWHHNDHDVFMFRCINRTLWPTGFRLAAVVRHTSGEIMYFTFESLTWSIGGAIVTKPTAAQLASLRPGKDFARLAPPREKPDQWAEIHYNFPAILMYFDEPGNAAAGLRDLELRVGCAADARATTPLFHDATGQPYTHAFLDRFLKTVLRHCFGDRAASIFTWHSYRAGLASALYAANVDDGTIQLICRWMCPESLHVYRRMGTARHATLVRSAMGARVDLIQTANVPNVTADHGYAMLVDEIAGPRSPAAQAEYERALAAALEPFAPTSSKAAPPRPPITLPTRVQRTAAPAAVEQTTSGDCVMVPRSVWPTYACNENGGAGWSVRIVSRTTRTAVVDFLHAHTTDGRRYQPERLPLELLTHPPAQRQ